MLEVLANPAKTVDDSVDITLVGVLVMRGKKPTNQEEDMIQRVKKLFEDRALAERVLGGSDGRRLCGLIGEHLQKFYADEKPGDDDIYYPLQTQPFEDRQWVAFKMWAVADHLRDSN